MFRSDDFSRVHRGHLVENGFLQDVKKGWLISSSPGARHAHSTPRYASFWDFCARYCGERFGDEWYLSPKQSLWLQGQRTVIPDQVVRRGRSLRNGCRCAIHPMASLAWKQNLNSILVPERLF